MNSCRTNGSLSGSPAAAPSGTTSRKSLTCHVCVPSGAALLPTPLDVLAVRQLREDFSQTDGIRGRKQEGLPLKFVLYPSNSGTDVSAVLVSRELLLKRPDVDLNSSKQLSALTFCILINLLLWYAVPPLLPIHAAALIRHTSQCIACNVTTQSYFHLTRGAGGEGNACSIFCTIA